MARMSKEYWKEYNRTPQRREYNRKLKAIKRAQLKNNLADGPNGIQEQQSLLQTASLDTKNNVSKKKETRHGKYRDPDYKRKWAIERRVWEEGLASKRPFPSNDLVININPDGTFSRPSEKEELLTKKINSARVSELEILASD